MDMEYFIPVKQTRRLLNSLIGIQLDCSLRKKKYFSLRTKYEVWKSIRIIPSHTSWAIPIIAMNRLNSLDIYQLDSRKSTVANDKYYGKGGVINKKKKLRIPQVVVHYNHHNPNHNHHHYHHQHQHHTQTNTRHEQKRINIEWWDRVGRKELLLNRFVLYRLILGRWLYCE